MKFFVLVFTDKSSEFNSFFTKSKCQSFICDFFDYDYFLDFCSRPRNETVSPLIFVRCTSKFFRKHEEFNINIHRFSFRFSFTSIRFVFSRKVENFLKETRVRFKSRTLQRERRG